MDFGRSPRPVSGAYQAPFVYPGVIHTALFEIPSLPPGLGQAEARAEVTAAMSRQ
jgi:hypothetical protein